MHPSSSVTRRALMAVGLMAGFYLLALLMAGGLLYLPLAGYRHSGEFDERGLVFCLLGAGLILWSVAPRQDRFEAPGPRLTSSEQPRLFAELEAVARATGQAMPSDVFLINEVNAWVSERGGVMGFGGRRVMGLGLPLMQLLTVPEFRGVVAHEFGHYQAGDTRLSPWIYKTHAAMARTLHSLGRSAGFIAFLRLPFHLYGLMFLRLTRADSRRQEYAADALAARIVGPACAASGLRAIHRATPAYQEFLQKEILPVMGAGFLPPLAEGFHQFSRTAAGAAARSAMDEVEPEKEASDPYDSHPSLQERLTALGALAAGAVPEDAVQAVTLLDQLGALESRLLQAAFADTAAGEPRPLSWDEVGTAVYAPHWRRLVEANRKVLAGVGLADLPWIARNPSELAHQLRSPEGHGLPEESWDAGVRYAVGAALSLNLLERGWTLEIVPGMPERMVGPRGPLHPFALIGELESGERGWSDWTEFLSREGLSEAALLPKAPEPAPAG